MMRNLQKRTWEWLDVNAAATWRRTGSASAYMYLSYSSSASLSLQGSSGGICDRAAEQHRLRLRLRPLSFDQLTHSPTHLAAVAFEQHRISTTTHNTPTEQIHTSAGARRDCMRQATVTAALTSHRGRSPSPSARARPPSTTHDTCNIATTRAYILSNSILTLSRDIVAVPQNRVGGRQQDMTCMGRSC